MLLLVKSCTLEKKLSCKMSSIKLLNLNFKSLDCKSIFLQFQELSCMVIRCCWCVKFVFEDFQDRFWIIIIRMNYNIFYKTFQTKNPSIPQVSVLQSCFPWNPKCWVSWKLPTDSSMEHRWITSQNLLWLQLFLIWIYFHKVIK